jgi:FixJ family two-component response regulator
MMKSSQDKMLDRRERLRRHIAVIDDYEPQVKTIAEVLGSAGYVVREFTNPHQFLDTLDQVTYDLVMADLVMPEMDGFELLRAVRQARPNLPVVVISGRGTIPLAVEAIRKGAVDFIQKDGVGKTGIVEVVNRVFEQAHISRERMPKELTAMEQQVLERVLSGYGNKDIAQELRLSVRTVEDHRRNMMRKMGVSNVVDLVRRSIELGFLRITDIPHERPSLAEGAEGV